MTFIVKAAALCSGVVILWHCLQIGFSDILSYGSIKLVMWRSWSKFTFVEFQLSKFSACE